MKQSENFSEVSYCSLQPAFKKAKPYQIRHYPSYLKKAKTAGATLFTCGLCFTELAVLIERNELDIFRQTRGPISPKEFRHNEPEARANVIGMVKDAGYIIRSMAATVDLVLDDGAITEVCDRMASLSVEPNDLLLVKAAFKQGISSVITDDGDFATIPNITVFTANENVIRPAKQIGRLLVR